MAATAENSIFTHLLEQLGVPHTAAYSDSRFEAMPFHTLFGLSKLLEEYGVESEGLLLSDKAQIAELTPPFIASTRGGFVIVTSVCNTTVSYLTHGEPESMALADFMPAWDGNVFLAFPTASSREPQYGLHARLDFFNSAKRWVLRACLVALFVYAFVTNDIWRQWSLWAVCAIDLLGLWLTYMLVQKSMNIKNSHADRVCGMLDAGGCDSILELKASKFFGLFGWSEVGFSYFSISLLCLLMFPRCVPELAACNILCLPFTFWSIWYQKFRARRWCTMCVGVQGSLWLLFFAYLGGGWVRDIFPLRIEFFVLGVCYVAALLALNALTPLISPPAAVTDDKTADDDE